MMEIDNFLGRSADFFRDDFSNNLDEMRELICSRSVLVIGAGGSIGKTITKQLFALKPKQLIAVDLSENSLVELVRDIRSSMGYLDVDFRTMAIDSGSPEFYAMVRAHQNIDFVFNLSALKHVRSERDPFTLMRLLKTNVLDVFHSLELFEEIGISRYFSVSTDKASKPVNIMGGSKLIMEHVLFSGNPSFDVTTARFANVAFSAGSLLDGFHHRIEKQQPLSAPSNIERYFISHEEAGRLSLVAGLLGAHNHTYYPTISDFKPINFATIATNFVLSMGYKPEIFDTEARARKFDYSANKNWPIYLFESNTTGEKDVEQFYSDDDEIVKTRYSEIGALKNTKKNHASNVSEFITNLTNIRERNSWSKSELVKEVNKCISEFEHFETGIYLDDKM